MGRQNYLSQGWGEKQMRKGTYRGTSSQSAVRKCFSTALAETPLLLIILRAIVRYASLLPLLLPLASAESPSSYLRWGSLGRDVGEGEGVDKAPHLGHWGHQEGYLRGAFVSRNTVGAQSPGTQDQRHISHRGMIQSNLMATPSARISLEDPARALRG